MKRSHLSARTEQTYAREIKRFQSQFEKLQGIALRDARDQDLRSYLRRYASLEQATTSGLRLHVAAIKHYFARQGRSLSVDLPYPEARPEPVRVLAPAELTRLFDGTRMHVCGLMLRLVYGAGLRLQEVTRILVGDIDHERGYMRVRGDRDLVTHTTIFPDCLRYDVIRQGQGRASDAILFSLREQEGRGPLPVARRTVQHFLSGATARLKLGRITVQTLRDNFAIALLRRGIDPRYVASFMGYRSGRALGRYQSACPVDQIRIMSPLQTSD
ncbi:MAG: tyrosine-type recombinase/integrase [Spirochaetales bacterium]|nr:tyrosine-type recombinase/integrase [Leptospiraceae bacterium]MCP5480876.1 tyrosine-type recombinase/integrase [Spirochaetales bacterium]